MEGSLLTWTWFLSIFSTLAIVRLQDQELKPYVAIIFTTILTFFLIVIVVLSNPFTQMSFIPDDGLGMNPLLQDPGMMVHPPTLFAGYAGLAIPFAFALAGLWTRNNDWIYHIRQWTLFSWLSLGLGIFFGGWWSYHVLGWGGYWAWDPVENASLIPWLLSTAFLHSVMIQEGKSGMKVWNMLLSIFTFLSVLYATFLTRSGIISSVHSFAQSPVGTIFLAFIVILLSVSIGLIIKRLNVLSSRNIFEAYLSRETTFLFNNLIFIVLTVIVFAGTTFPLVSEAIRGYQISIGPGYYNESFLPLTLMLILLMGVCPLIAWRQASFRSLKRTFLYPTVTSFIFTIIFIMVGIQKVEGLVVICISVFVTYALGREFLRQVRVERNVTHSSFPRYLITAIKRNPRKFGGQIIHIAIIIMLIGVAGSSLYSSSKMFTIEVNDTYHMDKYTFIFENITQQNEPDREVTLTTLDISIDGNGAQRFSPSISYYYNYQTSIRTPHISSTPLRDTYVILQDIQGNVATFVVKFIPLVNLIWISMAVIIFGTITAMFSRINR
jgi:cytochrome c-type biogenesis protein CcmF